MELCDRNTTLGTLKDETIAMCVRKGWGNNGIQHAQHIAMAMMVETMELLEHFADVPEEQLAIKFSDPEEVTEVAEEAADVMLYSLQIMYTMRYDVSASIAPEFSDKTTCISQLREHVGQSPLGLGRQAMRLGIKARFMLERFQWLNEDEVQALMRGEYPEKRKEIGDAFSVAFKEMLLLANKLDFDLAAAIIRKIGIVDKRVGKKMSPAR